ncbi:hypothetical protein CGSMWGv55152_05042, partial [Gardnerella vaginalis 55152]
SCFCLPKRRIRKQTRGNRSRVTARSRLRRAEAVLLPRAAQRSELPSRATL